MKDAIFSILLGYSLGCISPAKLISMIKNIDLRKNGTGNLGGTNVFVSVGKGLGVLVMLVDILKAFFAVYLSQILFESFAYSGVLAGAFAIVGHIFPFYLRFKGGKGTACLGGIILALDWRLFIPVLLIALIAAFITNYTCMTAITGATVFPIAYALVSKCSVCFFILALACGLIVYKHKDNLSRIKNKTEPTLRKSVAN
ncbi:MAG: glycerol-3-phosphate 1-O-acyltransferase PlsY [Clostridia bacterium]|nr:glycerol-3-phosphate 1-O-acyltransferase PlsY [Clostridia bacterium]